MGLASSRWPKWPGHSAMFAMQVSHFIFLSIVPSLGSLKPAVFGLPASIVSLCSICTTDICLCTSNKKQENEGTFPKSSNSRTEEKSYQTLILEKNHIKFPQRPLKPQPVTKFHFSLSLSAQIVHLFSTTKQMRNEEFFFKKKRTKKNIFINEKNRVQNHIKISTATNR